ncbi:hypothetical protein HYV70_05910 [Candidatus Uhrbacteria bacterium]|nr:hypothetical protein [Candidatus Uhrbacteria bacterium]
MNFRSYLILMTLGTLTAWVSWLVVVYGIDPSRSGMLGFFLFYLTLSMLSFGTISLLGLIFRFWRLEKELSSRITYRAFRQAILLTVIFIASLILLSQGWFRWWTMILIVIIAAFVELAFISTKRT